MPFLEKFQRHFARFSKKKAKPTVWLLIGLKKSF